MTKYTAFVLTFLLSNFLGIAQIQPPAGFSNNIILWLSPDTAVFEATNNPAEMNDRVVEWHDISGGGFVFNNSGGSVRPNYVYYQGKKMLNFVNGDLLENSSIASTINGLSEFSIYIVIKSDDVNTDQGFLDSENPDGADDILCMRYDASGANTGRTNLIKCGMQGNIANNQIESQNNTQTNQLQCLTLTWKQGEKINLYIDGVLNESSVNTLNSTMSGIQKILLGKGPKDTQSNRGWDGRIGTVIFYNTKMSPDTVSLISGDLKSINSVQSGDWDSPSTWDCNCNPPNNAFVRINSNHTVTLTKNETVNNVIVSNSGTLSLGANYRLSIRRDFTNHGNLVANNGEIRFNGTSEQLVNGSGTTNYYDLTVSNTSGVRVTDGAITVQGTIDLQNGCLETDNRVTLLSNASGTARIGTIPSGACITGDITMQRYIDAGATDWRFITSAVSGTTLADLNDDFITSGFIGSNFPNWPSAANPWPSIYFYDETATGIQDNGFVAATNVTNPIGVGEGLWVWSGDTITGTQPFTIDVSGAPNTGNINLPVTYTNSGLPTDDGWNMVGNPYPSTLDWDAPSITKTNLNNAIYIWNPDLQQFGSYVAGIGTNGASNNIASSQAFWIQANALNPVLTVTEASKTTTDGAFLKPTIIQPFRIKATNNNGSDEIAINFDINATNGFDTEFDAEKMTSVNTNLPRISSIVTNKEFSINQLPEQEITIPIKITCDITGLQQIEFQNVVAFGDVSCVLLEDLFTGTTYDLKNVSNITAYIRDTTTIARFLLHLGAPFNIDANNVSCFGKDDAAIVFSKKTSNPYDIIWKDFNNTIISSNTNIFSDTLSNISTGVYYIETTDAICGNRFDTVTINTPAAITSQFDIANDKLAVGEDFIPTNQSINATTYLWNFGDGNTSNLTAPIHQFNQSGEYTVTLTASQSEDCYQNYSKLISVIADEVVENTDLNYWIDNSTLNLNLNSEYYTAIELVNTLGQTIYNSTITNNTKRVDLSSFSNGVYIINLTTINKSSESFKVVYSH